jgi:hypothetical protein
MINRGKYLRNHLGYDTNANICSDHILKKASRTNWGKVPTTLSWVRHIYYDPPNIGYMNKTTMMLAIMSAIIATGLAISTYATPAFAALSVSSGSGDDDVEGGAAASNADSNSASSCVAIGRFFADGGSFDSDDVFCESG